MGHPFDTALNDVEPREPAAPAPSRALAGLVSNLPSGPQEGAGSHSLWEFAAAWTPEADPPPARPAPPPPPAPTRPSARAEDIEIELGLKMLKTTADVARRRRRFMWDNHPDRRKDLDRDLANRRVAIANMLFDRAVAKLMRRLAR